VGCRSIWLMSSASSWRYCCDCGDREGGPAYGGKSYEAIIRGHWKLLQNDPYSPLELYKLKDDPYETENLAATHRKVVNELATVLRGHIHRGGRTPWQHPESSNPAEQRR
jgi:hypothetical protein